MLIVLAILGIIATFAIPKVLLAQQENQKRAVMKETISTVEVIMQRYAQDYQLYGTAPSCKSRLNAIKVCNNSLAEGCWTAEMATTAESGELGFILANGAYVTGLCVTTTDWDGFIVDWNGPNPPNTFGEDTYAFASCLNPQGCTNGSTGRFGLLRRDSYYQKVFQ